MKQPGPTVAAAGPFSPNEKGKTAPKETKMSTRIQSRLRKSGASVVHWLMFALSLLTIGWVSFVPTGG
jgi:hypothetical protein